MHAPVGMRVAAGCIPTPTPRLGVAARANDASKATNGGDYA
jgi:hypothetical protein